MSSHIRVMIARFDMDVFMLFFQMRPRISIRGSVRPSVRWSITPVQKPRFLAVFGHKEILY